MPPNVGTGISVTGLLLFGTTTSLLAKIVYELQGKDASGHVKYFIKPWCMVTVMFLGMSFSLPIAYWEQWKENKRYANNPPLLEKERRKGESLKEILMLGIPSAFDLVATILMNIGLVSVTASVYQMLRGAEMLFAAMFAVIFLGRKLNRYHYGGIFCCLIGITLVGVASVLSGEGSATQTVSTKAMVVGMLLIIASQSVQAAQITYEDFFMADLNIAPLKIVGYEGLWGSVAMIAILLPAVYFIPGEDGHGLHEDTLETFQMIRNTPTIATVLAVDMFALLMYNFSGMCVTGNLGAVFRTVLETMRTLFVWLVGLLLYYTPLGMGKLGESWNWTSWIQAVGFLVLVAGTLIYGRGDDEEIKALVLQEREYRPAEPTPAASALDMPTTDASTSPPKEPTEPINMSTSFYKSTMALSSFSPQSLSRSHVGGASVRGPSNLSSSYYGRSLSGRSSGGQV